MHSARCPAPGDEQALLDLACAIATSPLPWFRPLWSATLVTGLADGTVGLVVVLHHVVADGLGGLALLGALTDGPGVDGATAAEVPRPRPRVAALAADAVADKVRGLSRLPGAAATVRGSMASVGGLRPAGVADNSLLRRSGTRRRVAVVRTDLEAVRAAAHHHGGTVNDVVLTAVASALGGLLSRRGERAHSLTVAVPVAARRPQAGSGLGNRIGIMLVPVPCDGPPRQRLATVAARTRVLRRATTHPPPLESLGPAFRLAARLGLYRWFMVRQRRMHTLVSNLRGPRSPASFAGAPVRSIVALPVGEAGNITVSFVVLSYAGTLAITVTVDPDHVPRPSTLAEDVLGALRELGAA